MKKLSAAQIQVLKNKAAGLPADDHVYGMSMHGGFVHTIRSLRQRGLIEWDSFELTTEGAKVAASLGFPCTMERGK